MSARVQTGITLLLLVGFGFGYAHFDPLLPDRVAQTFGGDGEPVGWTNRAAFWKIGGFVTAIVLVSFHATAFCTPRMPRRWFKNDARVDGPERPAMLALIVGWLLFAGNATLVMMGCMYWLVIDANLAPRHPLEGFGWVAGTYSLFMLVAIVWIIRRRGAAA